MTLKVHRIGKKHNKMVDFLETVYDVCFSLLRYFLIDIFKN